MTLFGRTALIVFFSLSLASCANANDDPSETVRNYYQVVASGDYAAAAKMFHPDGIAELRSRLDFLYDSDDGYLNGFWHIFGEDVEPAAVKAMTDQAFFEVLYIVVIEQAISLDRLDPHKYEVLGAVMEGDQTAHVLVRGHASVDDKSYDYLFVQTLHRIGERWALGRDVGVEGLVVSLETKGELIE